MPITPRASAGNANSSPSPPTRASPPVRRRMDPARLASHTSLAWMCAISWASTPRTSRRFRDASRASVTSSAASSCVPTVMALGCGERSRNSAGGRMPARPASSAISRYSHGARPASSGIAPRCSMFALADPRGMPATSTAAPMPRASTSPAVPSRYHPMTTSSPAMASRYAAAEYSATAGVEYFITAISCWYRCKLRAIGRSASGRFSRKQDKYFQNGHLAQGHPLLSEAVTAPRTGVRMLRVRGNGKK